MHPLTIAALTALHALSHRIDLTSAEIALLDAEAPSLCPGVWQVTVSLLAEADAAGDGATLHLGFDRLILAWLRCRDEAECRGRYDLTVTEALAADQGSLAHAARVVDGDRDVTVPEAREAIPQLVEVWSERAARLVGTGEDAVSIASFERAVSVCPLPEETARALWTTFIDMCEAHGNRALASLARERLPSPPDENEDALALIVILVFSVLWAVTHDAFVLRCEHGLDRHVERSPEAWERIRVAVAEGRVADLPLPVESFAAWCPGPGLDADALSGCIRSCEMATLAEYLATVEAVLSGEGEPDSLPPTGLALVLEICRMRRNRIERDYEPVPGERRNIHYELQGARRPEALERVDLMRRLNGVLARYGSVDPDVRMCLALDLAAESESRGEHDATRQHLEDVRRAAVLMDDAGRRECAEVCLAKHHWQLGDVDRANAILADLTSDRAVDARNRFDAMASARARHRAAVDTCHRTPGLEAWSALAHAEMAAGHSIAGERTAQALTRAYPGRSLAWTTMARVLHEHGRHRDAVEPAREAVRLTEGAPNDSALLACILARIGEDGREESLELAERAIVEMVRSATGSVVVLASMADIVSRYADRDEPSLRHAHAADDLIWAQRDTQTVPPEWLGAAASRRCQSAWAPDAVLWLVRLAEASAREPAAPARWVVERLDSLGCMLLDPRAASREATLAPVPGAATIRRQSLSALLHVALSLGYNPDQAAAAIGLRTVELVTLGSEPTDDSLNVFDFVSPSHVWAEHLSVLERGFGPGLVVRLRGSAAAQRALNPSEDEAATILGVLESEQIEWIRWAAEQPEVRALQDEGSVLDPATRERLVRVMELATLDDESLRRVVWQTSWEETVQ